MPQVKNSLRWDRPEDLVRAFPASLARDAGQVVAEIDNMLDPVYRSGAVRAIVSGEEVIIPQRIHLIHPRPMNTSSDSVRAGITACLLTRNTDGFRRQEGLSAIVTFNRPWSIPYIMLLVGEYVIEILMIVRDNLGELDRTLIKSFISENQEFYSVIKQRVASYWDAYYRSRYAERESYVGFQIIHEFDSW
jgi:hypothetical protein